MLKIYTRTGDDGTTHLIGGRTSKASDQIEAIGTVDELNAALGVVLSTSASQYTHECLQRVQRELFTLGAELAVGPRPGRSVSKLTQANVAALEDDIDIVNGHLMPLKNFILPGGSSSAAHLHLSRAICRRTERCVVALGDTIRPELRHYLNRLSDLLFTLARAENNAKDVPEVTWTADKQPLGNY